MELIKDLSQKLTLTLILAIALLLGLIQFGSSLFGFIGDVIPHTASARVDPSSVVLQLRGATDLTTAIYAAETVVPASQIREWRNLKLGETKLLYIAKGEVRAGVDLSQITTDNIDLINGSIHLVLPAPRILDRKLDIEHSAIYDIRKGLFGPDVKEELHVLAERKALQKMVASACEKGLLDSAGEKAEAVVVQLLTKAGYKDISVDLQTPANNGCPGSI